LLISDDTLAGLIMENQQLQEDSENDDDVDGIISDLSKLAIQNEQNEKFSIFINGQCLKCSKELLRTNSKFFDAFFNFDPDKESIDLKGGGLDFASCETLLKYWRTSRLEISTNNAQDLLRGGYFV